MTGRAVVALLAAWLAGAFTVAGGLWHYLVHPFELVEL